MVEISETYDLASVTDQFMISRGITNKKYFGTHLYNAKLVFKYLFKNTIYSVQSQWQPLRKGDPYPYINMPIGRQRLFSCSVVDKCGTIVPLKYGNYVNIIPQPTVNTCSCDKCVCDGGICEDVGGLTKITKLLFTVNGTDYYETVWVKLCPNGDIIEYRNVPVKKYSTFTGDGGDYNSDYNNDYLTENPPFSDYTIVYEDFQRILCNLEVKECGCPVNTVSNEELFLQHCGGYCQPFSRCRTNQNLCKKVYDDTNFDDCRLGQIKVSECGNKIYYIPPQRPNGVPPAKLPEYILVNYQVSGENCTETVRVPEYLLETMFYGMDYYSKRFNGMYNSLEKRESRYAWVNAQNEAILYLSNFNLQKLAQIQDTPILY